MSEEIRVLVCDAQRLLAEALGGMLATRKGLAVHGRFPHSGVATVSAARDLQPDVAVIDYWLAGMDGPAVLRAVTEHSPDTKVVNLSWFHGSDHVQQALAAGAVAFLPKSISVERVAEAVRRAHAGQCPVFAEELGDLTEAIDQRGDHARQMAQRLARLSPRELEVLRLAGAGLKADEISDRLVISAGTVRNHINSALRKTDTHSQQRLLAVARDHGVIP